MAAAVVSQPPLLRVPVGDLTNYIDMDGVDPAKLERRSVLFATTTRSPSMTSTRTRKSRSISTPLMSGPSKRCSRGLRTLHSKCVLHYHCLVVDISVAIRHYGQSMMGLTYYCNMKGYVKHAGWKALKSFFPLNLYIYIYFLG